MIGTDRTLSAGHAGVNRGLGIGLIAGSLLGLALRAWGPHPAREWLLANVAEPIGQAFLRGLFMVVVPLIFSSLALGVAQLGSLRQVGRLGGRLGAYYMLTTLIAILIGQALVLTVRPGAGLDPAVAAAAREAMASQVAGLAEKSQGVPASLWPGLVQTVIPRNVVQAMAEGNTLAVIFVAMVFGLALLKIEPGRAAAMRQVLGATAEACEVIVGWIMRLAPVAVGALIMLAVTRLGLDLLRSVALYMAVVVAGYLLHLFGTYAVLARWLGGWSPRAFYREALPILVTAFGTSSSNATLPTTLRALEERFRVPPALARFSAPLGATVNMDGTALFEAVAALFIAQVFGVEIGWGGQVTLVALVLITSIGVAGIPGGSLPVLMSAMALLGIPAEGIALILGVDRLLDMGRTVVNVTGDVVGTLYLARRERESVGQA